MLGKFIDASQRSRWLNEDRAATSRWLELDRAELSAYNSRPFTFRHRLAEHPLFTFDALRQACRRLNPGDVKVRAGVIPHDTDFDTSLGRFRAELTPDEAFDRVQKEAGGYVAIYNPETDPEYREAIEGFLGEIAAFIAPVDPCINWYSTYVFVSSENSVTPYHMDREMNFLMQVRGHKTVQLWDPHDPAVMTPAERDRLLSYAGESRPQYREGLAARAMTFELGPGLGVHHPFIAPHLVRTGAEPSVTLAVTFRTAASDVWTDASRLNQALRERGLRPRPVGRSPLRDRLKSTTVRVIRALRAVKR